MTTARDVRKRLRDALRRDLIGPGASDRDLINETLNTPPSRWYLTGFLAPQEETARPVDDADANDDLFGGDDGNDGDDMDDTTEPAGLDGQADGAPAKKKYLPSSIGLTFLLEPEVREIEVEVSWGDYTPEPPLESEGLFSKEALEGEEGVGLAGRAREVSWVRHPRSETLRVSIPKNGRGDPIIIPHSASPVWPGGGLQLIVHAKPTTLPTPAGGRPVCSVALFLVNARHEANMHFRDVSYAFQAAMSVRSGSPIVSRADLSGYMSEDPDLRIADLHYRDSCEFAVGRNTSASWPKVVPDEGIRKIWTEALPEAEVERVAPNEKIADVIFGMEDLAEAARDTTTLNVALANLPEAYGEWIATQEPDRHGIRDKERIKTAQLLRDAMLKAQARIASAIALLSRDARARQAFRLMNLAIATAARQRTATEKKSLPRDIDQPVWRPFQLAFILLNLDSLTDKGHPDRELVDLLFFPTGGGKTEAYLGLSAFTIAYRRISSTGLLGAGVTVIMRYTLRLLTLDQLGRAAGMICALELLREDPANALGEWPIEIGLWVGSDASPNRLNDGTDRSAVARVRRFRKTGKQAPAPVKACPWCGTPFEANSFRPWPTEKAPQRLLIKCANVECAFHGDRNLPILVTDEEIYRRLPAFMIATVDKFAALPWVGDVGAFFGHVERADDAGFYGAAAPGGKKLEQPLGPPDLIIQDELHLITGPLGTVAALYECAIDRLASRDVDGKRVRPKIVASTATARRAGAQIRALFDRNRTEIFPPPGLDRRDSFFAHTLAATDENPARLYVGVAATGKGQKLVFLRALRTLMAAAQKAYEDEGVDAADAYLTALCYFNALRELGSARRIVEDDVKKDLVGYGSSRLRWDPSAPDFANRSIGDPLELTSRVSTDKVAQAKQRLEKRFPASARDKATDICDVAMATNMISVGLDISRLGLMVVNGQPKTASEYIQATSRVGRDHHRPGLVVTLLNPHKPRDRAHYESFRHFHEAFYRAVEGASVTPWSPRALDRALPALTVSLARHLEPHMSADGAAGDLGGFPTLRDAIVSEILDRAGAETDGLEIRIDTLLDAWGRINEEAEDNAVRLGYTLHGGANRKLLQEALDTGANLLSPDEKMFRAPRSMRGVEASVRLRIQGPYKEWLD